MRRLLPVLLVGAVLLWALRLPSDTPPNSLAPAAPNAPSEVPIETWAASTEQAPAGPKPAPVSVPTRITPASNSQFHDVAVRFLKAAVRPRPSRSEQWWVQVAPFLTADALFAYVGFDPAAISYTSVVGRGKVVARPGPAEAIVHVPTDTGMWRVRVVNELTGLHIAQAGPLTPRAEQ